MRRAPASATIDQVQVLGGALVRLLALTHVSVQATSARRHRSRLHCERLVNHLVLQQVGGHSTTGRFKEFSTLQSFLQQMLVQPGQ